LLPSLTAAEVIEADLCIYGGTASWVVAAVQAARMGKTAAIAEFGNHLGGLTSGGLGATDIGNKAAIGGIARS
jgi:ribulose 1,5-bisphosphate synthetase/thiazole synthase